MLCPKCGHETPGTVCPKCGCDLESVFSKATVAEQDVVVINDRYRLGKLLGQGGMGEVYECYDRTLNRQVAIKFLGTDLQSHSALADRFRREALTLAKIEHHCVVPIHEVGEHDGRPYFVMRLLQGRTLADTIKQRGRLPPEEVIAIGAAICEGLSAIHAAGCVHRDIKPANIMMSEGGECTILDFGIMRTVDSDLTASGIAVGSPTFMAPEQGRDSRLADARSDLYALGATLYSAFTGTHPFAAASDFEMLAKHHSEALEAPSKRVPALAPTFDGWFDKAMAKDPNARFQSAAAMREALLRLGSPHRLSEVTSPSTRRRSLPVKSALALAVTVLAGAAWFVFQPTQAKVEQPDGPPTQPADPPALVNVVSPPPLPTPAPEPDVRPVTAIAKPSASPSAHRTPRDTHRPVALQPATLRILTKEDGRSTWANIMIDGEAIGVAPILNHAIAPGQHVITAHRDGYQPVRTVTTFKANESRKILLEMVKAQP